MEYIKATCENIDGVLDIVQNTVKTIYPKYYPKEVVQFSVNFTTERILQRI